MNALSILGPYTIVESIPKSESPTHDVLVRLDNGRALLLSAANYGMCNYPHVGRKVVIVGEGTPHAYAIVSNTALEEAWSYDPMHGRFFAINNILQETRS